MDRAGSEAERWSDRFLLARSLRGATGGECLERERGGGE